MVPIGSLRYRMLYFSHSSAHNLLPPATKLGQGNIFCSRGGGGWVSRPTPGGMLGGLAGGGSAGPHPGEMLGGLAGGGSQANTWGMLGGLARGVQAHTRGGGVQAQVGGVGGLYPSMH